MARRSPLVEVAAPDGRVFLIGSGGFARYPGGPFSIVAYPFGKAGLAHLGQPPYVEPVRGSDAYFRRLDQLTESIRYGTWEPPSLPDAEIARLQARAARREERRMYVEEHPVRSLLMAAAHMSLVISFFVVVGAFGDVLSGRHVNLPSPVPLVAVVVSWTALLTFLSRRNARHSRPGSA
jgi:hypothetical protein